MTNTNPRSLREPLTALSMKTSHSQIMGSVVGIGIALHEETLFDHRSGLAASTRGGPMISTNLA